MSVAQHVYRPRGAARRLLSCRADEVLLSGPAGTGKSRGCLEKLNLAALKYPGMRGLIVRKTQKSLSTSALQTWRKHVIPELDAIGQVGWYGGSAEEPAQYRYANGSAVVVGGMDLASKVMSTEYDLVFAQEAIELTLTDWEALTTRLRNGVMPYQQLIADTNPDAEHHWLKQRANAGTTTLLESRHEDNPLYFDEGGQLTEAGRAYIEGKLDKLTGVRYLRLRKGLWVSAEGVIYEDFDPAVHLLDAMPKGWETWPRYWSIDWGFTNPMVVQFWAEDNDGRLYLYREIYHTQRLVEDVARQVMGIVAPGGVWAEPQPQAIVCDHDAGDRATFERHTGQGTVPARKDVSTGLQATQARYRPAGDGKPRIFILRDALVERDEQLAEAGRPCCTAEEVPGYVWKKGPDGKPVPEEPEKKDDHGCDAKRYMVMHRELGDSFFRWLE